MGLTCKPIGKMQSYFAKLDNQLNKEKQAIKIVKKAVADEKKKER